MRVMLLPVDLEITQKKTETGRCLGDLGYLNLRDGTVRIIGQMAAIERSEWD